jgi:hypothetical protein
LQQLPHSGPIDPDPCARHELEFETAGRKEPIERFEPRGGISGFDPRDGGLCHASATTQLSLAEVRLLPSVTKQSSGVHA